MSSTSSKPLLVAALCVATALAGCGDKKKDATTASTPPAATTVATTPEETPTPVATSPSKSPTATPTEIWVHDTCDKLSKSTKALQPPTVQGTTPEKTKESLQAFFGQLATQLGNQQDALKAAGPPPGPNAQREYKKALAQLTKVEAKIKVVADRVKAADVSSAAEVQALVADLGKSLQVMSNYDGPIAQLMKTNSLGKALAAEPACASLGLAGQSTTS